jgi:glutamyl-tRNA synthetase
MPLLRNPDKSKLSKRKNPTGIDYYRAAGYLPQALLNYLGMMGWTMPDGQEKFSLEQMAENFDVTRVSLGGPVFDLEKLSWLNGRYIREDLSVEQLATTLRDWALAGDTLLPILGLIHQRVEKLNEVLPKIAHFFSPAPELSETSFAHKKLTLDDCKRVLVFASRRLDEHSEWDAASLRTELEKLGAALDMKIRDLLFPLFVALSGQAVSTPLFETLHLLGADLSRARLRMAIEAIGGVSKKQAKLFDKEYAQLTSQPGGESAEP